MQYNRDPLVEYRNLHVKVQNYAFPWTGIVTEGTTVETGVMSQSIAQVSFVFESTQKSCSIILCYKIQKVFELAEANFNVYFRKELILSIFLQFLPAEHVRFHSFTKFKIFLISECKIFFIENL